MQRVMQGIQQEMESLQEPDAKAEPGQMPDILSRRPAPGGSASGGKRYPWERGPDAEELPPERRRRY